MKLTFIILFILLTKPLSAENEITIDRESIQATSNGGEFSIKVSSNHSWGWASKSDWVQINAPPIIDGDYKFKIIIKPNNSSKTRISTVTLFLNSDNILTSKEITITQQSETTRLELSSEERYSSGDGGEFSISVSSNTFWTWDNMPEWVTSNFSRNQERDVRLTFNVNPNPLATPREATLSFYTMDIIGGIVSREYLIRQGGGEPTLEIRNNGQGVPADGRSYTITIKSNANWTWNKSDLPNWITSSEWTQQNGNRDFRFTVLPNNSTERRNFRLNFNVLVEGSNLSDSYSISQVAFEPTLEIRNNGQGVPADGRSYTITIKSNANWTWNKSDLPNWITSSEWTQQNGNRDFRFTVLPNNSTERRNFRLNFNVLVEGSNLSDSYSISQVAGTPFLNLNADSENISSFGGSFTLEVSSNTEWNWVEKPNWITITSDSAQSGNGTINYIVSPNDSNLIRQGLVIITSQGEHEPITREISVLQEGSTNNSDQKPKIQSIIPIIKNGQAVSMYITFTSSPGASYEIMYSKDLKSWDFLEKITARDHQTESRIEAKFSIDPVMFYKIEKSEK